MTVALKGREFRTKIGKLGWTRLRYSNPVDDFTQALRIPFPVRRAAKLVVPEDLNRTYIFAAIKAGHSILELPKIITSTPAEITPYFVVNTHGFS